MSTTTAPLVATSPTPTLVDMDEATQPSQRSSFEQQYHASTQMDSKSVPALSEVVETKEDTSHIEGMKLIIVIVGLTVVVFLIMIDLSIVSTVSKIDSTTTLGNNPNTLTIANNVTTGHPSDHE